MPPESCGEKTTLIRDLPCTPTNYEQRLSAKAVCLVEALAKLAPQGQAVYAVR